jgi:hypothetical protein
MSETQQTTDEAGVARTETGEIAEPETSTTTETKQEDGTFQPKETSEKKEGSLINEGPDGAPEAYADFKVPDGFTLDPEVSKEAGTIFKDLNLTQDSAQRLVDFYVSKTQEAAQQPFKTWENMQKEWRDAVAKDTEIGGKLAEVKTTVSRAIDSLGDAKLASDFREAMDITGAGNHPAFVKAFYRLARQVTEGGHVQGGKPSPLGQQAPGERRSLAQNLYPSLP